MNVNLAMVMGMVMVANDSDADCHAYCNYRVSMSTYKTIYP